MQTTATNSDATLLETAQKLFAKDTQEGRQFRASDAPTLSWDEVSETVRKGYQEAAAQELAVEWRDSRKRRS